MSGMWFALGVLCGGAAVACLLRTERKGVCKAEKQTAPKPTKTWGETHNFLYYDGTVMPEIKEDLHEQ